MRCIPLHLWCFFEPPIPSHQASWVLPCSLCLSLLLPLTRLQMPVYLFASSSRLLAPWEQQPSSSLYIAHQTAQCMAHRRYLVSICKMTKQGKKRGGFFFWLLIFLWTWYYYDHLGRQRGMTLKRERNQRFGEWGKQNDRTRKTL